MTDKNGAAVVKYIKWRQELASNNVSKDTCLPEAANTVIVGAGIVGCNIAYQLSELGRNDIVVIDQGPMPTTGGSSSYAHGIMIQTDEPKILSKFAQYSRKLYSNLKGEDGRQAYNQVGGIEVARSDDRMDYLQRRVE